MVRNSNPKYPDSVFISRYGERWNWFQVLAKEGGKMTIWKYSLYTILVICLLLVTIAGFIFSYNYKPKDNETIERIKNIEKLLKESNELERQKIDKIKNLRGKSLTNYIRSLKK
jgi:hypothetical protein